MDLKERFDLSSLSNEELEQKLHEEFMYYAAMKSKQCRLPTLGQHYWRLVHEDRI